MRHSIWWPEPEFVLILLISLLAGFVAVGIQEGNHPGYCHTDYPTYVNQQTVTTCLPGRSRGR